jgi:hypothetical protein
MSINGQIADKTEGQQQDRLCDIWEFQGHTFPVWSFNFATSTAISCLMVAAIAFPSMM